MNTKRSCGVLLPLFSLLSEHGIGTLGKAAYEFIDFLAAAGQSWWQLLPVGPAGSGDSPYNSFSSFAGNAYFIDPDMLVQDGLLTKAEVSAVDWGNDEQSVDYEKLRAHRMPLLRKAARRGLEKDAAEFDSFCRDNASWLSDYALYMALKEHFGGASWTEWPEDIRLHRAEVVEKYRAVDAEIRRLESTGVPESPALNEMLERAGTAPVHGSARLSDLVRRPQIGYDDLAPFDPERPELPAAVREAVEIGMKYEGYLRRQEKQVEEFQKEESRLLPPEIDYAHIEGLRVEARQKLNEIRPLSVGQASRISGVSPSDIAVLLIWLQQHK